MANRIRFEREDDDLESMEETLAILRDPQMLAEIRSAQQSVKDGDVVRGVEAVRALRPRTHRDGGAS